MGGVSCKQRWEKTAAGACVQLDIQSTGLADTLDNCGGTPPLDTYACTRAHACKVQPLGKLRKEQCSSCWGYGGDMCLQVEGGTYDSAQACLEALGKYACKNGACVLDATGVSLEECQRACWKWQCNPAASACVQAATGVYGTEAACGANCWKYSPAPGGAEDCERARDGSYATLEQCFAEESVRASPNADTQTCAIKFNGKYVDLATCQDMIARFGCDASTQACARAEGAAYASRGECEGACWGWALHKDSNVCQQVQGGQFGSLAACDAAYSQWACTPEAQCVRGPEGASSEAGCGAACWRYKRVPEEGCVRAPDGAYDTLEECQKPTPASPTPDGMDCTETGSAYASIEACRAGIARLMCSSEAKCVRVGATVPPPADTFTDVAACGPACWVKYAKDAQGACVLAEAGFDTLPECQAAPRASPTADMAGCEEKAQGKYLDMPTCLREINRVTCTVDRTCARAPETGEFYSEDGCTSSGCVRYACNGAAGVCTATTATAGDEFVAQADCERACWGYVFNDKSKACEQQPGATASLAECEAGVRYACHDFGCVRTVSDSGSSASEAECGAACWRWDDAGNFECARRQTGSFDTQAECDVAQARYSLDKDRTCVRTFQGTYESQQACEAVLTRHTCNAGAFACVQDDAGAYADEAACGASCWGYTANERGECVRTKGETNTAAQCAELSQRYAPLADLSGCEQRFGGKYTSMAQCQASIARFACNEQARTCEKAEAGEFADEPGCGSECWGFDDNGAGWCERVRGGQFATVNECLAAQNMASVAKDGKTCVRRFKGDYGSLSACNTEIKQKRMVCKK